MVDKIGKWSEDKLKILGKYLNAYTKIMANQTWCKGYHYIDAFAASGIHQDKEEKSFIEGSPRVALKIDKPFTSYTFIEINEERIKKLNSLRKEFPQMSITVERGDCNRVIVEKIFPQIRSRSERGFVFLDPYGLDVSMEIVKQIALKNIFEAFINFPVMAINRTVKARNPEVSTQKEKDRMNIVMGDGDWVKENSSEQLSFLEEIESSTIFYEWPNLVKSYTERLRKVFNFVSEPLIMTTEKNAPLYALIFAGNNETGCKIMNDIIQNFKMTGGK